MCSLSVVGIHFVWKRNFRCYFFLGDSVWKNWGFIITVNVAVVGWLLQRHGLYSLSEKII